MNQKRMNGFHKIISIINTRTDNAPCFIARSYIRKYGKINTHIINAKNPFNGKRVQHIYIKDGTDV